LKVGVFGHPLWKIVMQDRGAAQYNKIGTCLQALSCISRCVDFAQV